MNQALDYVEHLGRESARFLQALRQSQPDTQVLSCPDWNADDLLWHLGEVQWFWGTIVRENVPGSKAEELKPERPPDRAGLFDFFERASRDLQDILAARTPDAAAWTWSEEQTVGFIRRRQAHEALIHRIDAELVVADRTEMDPHLSADGVDEALRIMYGGVPSWGSFTPDDARTVRLIATDTGDSWFVWLGRFSGTDPEDTTYDEPDIHAADIDPGTDASATVAGPAADLDCWLWRRPTVSPLGRSGHQQVLSDFESTIGAGID